jgi:hypothetical protein
VNYLCLIGVVIGLVSIVGPWTIFQPYWWHWYLGRHIETWSYSALYDRIYAPDLFIIGLIISIITPLGSILLTFGIYGHLIALTNYMQGVNTAHHWMVDSISTIFLLFALVSTGLIILSMRSSSWASRDDGSFPRPRDRMHPLHRLLTFSLIKEKVRLELPVVD